MSKFKITTLIPVLLVPAFFGLLAFNHTHFELQKNLANVVAINTDENPQNSLEAAATEEVTPISEATTQNNTNALPGKLGPGDPRVRGGTKIRGVAGAALSQSSIFEPVDFVQLAETFATIG